VDKQFVGGNNKTYIYEQATNRLKLVNNDQAMMNYGLTYDANGNVTGTGKSDYQFDQLNRLAASDDGSTVLNNIYDGHNMRVKGVSTSDGKVKTTYYVYTSQGDLLHEYDAHSGEARDHIQLNGRTIVTMGTHNKFDTDNDGLKGTANKKDVIKSRDALPPYGNSGGLPELIIDPSNVDIIDFSVLRP